MLIWEYVRTAVIRDKTRQIREFSNLASIYMILLKALVIRDLCSFYAASRERRLERI